MKNNKKKGFTLMELLIVIAIIVILVAIAIPTFTKQLTKAHDATDIANVRSAYAELQTNALTADSQFASGDALIAEIKKKVTLYNTADDALTVASGELTYKGQNAATTQSWDVTGLIKATNP